MESVKGVTNTALAGDENEGETLLPSDGDNNILAVLESLNVGDIFISEVLRFSTPSIITDDDGNTCVVSMVTVSVSIVTVSV